MKKIFNYIMLLAVSLSGLTLTACSDDELDTNQYNKSGVNILAFGPMPVTRGDAMRVTGTQLNKVKEVLFPEGNQKLSPSTNFINAEFTLANSEEMTVVIPDMCVPGKIRLVTNDNDTIVSASNVSFVEEIKVAGISPTQVHPGDIVTISGEYVWNIGEVTFAAGKKVPAEEFVLNTRNEIQVRVPMDAQTGAVTYNDGSEGAEEIVITDNLLVDAAVATSVSNATPEFNEQITIYGENLDLITSVDFPSVAGVEYTVASDGKSITVVVPANTVNGNIVLTSASGLTTSVEITVPLITYTSVTPAEDVREGDEITITGTLLDRVTKLVLPGDITLEQGSFSQSATEIKFTVPEGMGDGAVTLVQHENYSVTTDKIAMHHEGTEIPIWQGSVHVGNWDGSMAALSWGGYDWSQVKAGQVLSIYLTPDMTEGWSQLRVGNGSWAALPGTSDPYSFDNADEQIVRITLTDAMLSELVNNGGLVLCGAWWTCTKVTLSPLETVLWEGEALADDWANQPYMLSDAGAELAAAGAQVGQAVHFYITPIADDWKLEILEGHWGPSYGAWGAVGYDTENGKFAETDLAATGGKVTIFLTQAMLDAAYTQQWWGGTFILNGDNVKCTKITLE